MRPHYGSICARPHNSRQSRSVTRCFDPQNPVTSVNDAAVNKTCSFRPCIDIHKVLSRPCLSCLTKDTSMTCFHASTLQGQVKQIVGSSLNGSSEDKYGSWHSCKIGLQWCCMLGNGACAGDLLQTLHQKSLLSTMLACTNRTICQGATSSCWEQMMLAGNKVLVSQNGLSLLFPCGYSKQMR